MRTSEPILTRGRDHWDRVNLPESEFRDRAARVREAMAGAGLDALLVYGVGDRDGDIAYLSNLVHKVPGFPLALALTPETAVVLNQRSSRTRPIVERSTWIDDVRFTRDLWATFEEVLAEQAGADARVGFVGADALAVPDHEALDALRETWAIDRVDGYLDPIRRTKSARERDQLRRSGRLLATVDELLSDHLAAPTRERRLAAELDRMARLAGAQDVRVLVGNPGQTEDALRPPEDLSVNGGAAVSLYLAVRYEGYWSALARTPTLGDTLPEAAGVGDLTAVYEDLLSSFGPDEDAAALVATARAGLADHGLELDGRYPVLSGLGLELDEPPTLGAGAEPEGVELTPGTALEVVLAARAEGSPTAVLGDTVLVTDDGAEVLTR